MSPTKQSGEQDTEPNQAVKSTRQSRLEDALRANLQKRKEQARQRQKGPRRTLTKG